MKQKEIWSANLNPALGREQKGIRPVVIISGNAMNNNTGICIVCPLTSKIKNFAGCIVLQPDQTNNLKAESEVLTFQIRTIAKKRLQRKIGSITDDQLQKVKDGLIEICTF